MYKKINRNMRFIAMFTLLITVAFITVVCYSIFTSRIKEEIRGSALLMSEVLDSGGGASMALDYMKDSFEGKRAVIVAPDGSAVYDSSGRVNTENYNGRTEIIAARKNGTGERTQYSVTRGAEIYYFAAALGSGNVLLVDAVINRLWVLFVTIGIPAALLAVLVYLLSIAVSARITENIIRPIEKSYSFARENYDDVYVEIQPFLKRIAQQNKEIRRNIADLKRAEKIRREFSANVSHELKTPLTSIKGYSQLINSGIAKPEDIPEFSRKIENEAGRLIILIDDIIKLSDLDENDTVLEKTKINLLASARDCAERLSGLASQRDIKINVEGTDAPVTANTHQIDELVYNLIDNAVKYNRDGGVVSVETGTENAKSFIRVSDTGIGIPEKYLDRIFERFFRVDKSHSKRINGTGLGLSIVKHIAIINNAEISVESEPDKGSSFTVTFG